MKAMTAKINDATDSLQATAACSSTISISILHRVKLNTTTRSIPIPCSSSITAVSISSISSFSIIYCTTVVLLKNLYHLCPMHQ